ncbi:hypothetical protein ACHAW6_009380 [Cyclotella cf. meneghiniana]
MRNFISSYNCLLRPKLPRILCTQGRPFDIKTPIVCFGILVELWEFMRRELIWLFWHTGGALGIYEKGDDLADRLEEFSLLERIDIYQTKMSKTDHIIVLSSKLVTYFCQPVLHKQLT